MSKFFINKSDITGNIIIIAGEDVSHIKKVLRLKVGNNLTLCDGNSMDYNCVIEKIDEKAVTLRIMCTSFSDTEPKINVTLYQGIPKSDKFDYIIQKSVELGVKSIVPIITERTVVKIENESDGIKKAARWQKIAYEAAKQSNRGIIPKVELPIAFSKALEQINNYQLKIIPYEKENKIDLKSVLNEYIINVSENKGLDVSVIIGPEGGFTEEEVEKAKEKGVQSVTLGPRILRTETAGVNVLSILMYELGD
ncbi:MAG: 16S rRNA (uracil(1498)-N(3))-methyltransferase [Clostridia bacterium]|jgi:16S rRNA (uracil1498-N3)-methyltransferase